MAELMAPTELVGNARVSPLQRDAEGMVTGFVIDNPRGPDLKVSLNGLLLEGATPAQINALRQVVYDAYVLGAMAVPAFTPLSECIAQSTTLIVHSDANWDGMRFKYVPIPHHPQGETQFFANVQGNPLLPDHESTFSFQGVVHKVVVEQQNKYYQGKDGRWYTTHPLELVMHELPHGCGKLQAWSSEDEAAYQQDLASGKVPMDEVRAVRFVNQTLLEPRGLPGRDPQSYYEVKPDGEVAVKVPALDAAALEKLRQGPVPDELQRFSRPGLKAIESGFQGRYESNHPNGLAFASLGRALEKAGLCEAAQSDVIAQRIVEHTRLSAQNLPVCDLRLNTEQELHY